MSVPQTLYLERCKCCLEDSGLQKMWEIRMNNGDREVYGELIMECFALEWAATEDELICENCIRRIKDAVLFKKEFLAVQECLQDDKNNVIVTIMDQETKTSLVDKQDGMTDEYTEVEYLNIDDCDENHLEPPPSIKKKKKRNEKQRLYKQYTFNELQAAKKAVEDGLSVLAAAEKYGIPRKTLVNKLNPPERDDDNDASLEKLSKLVEEIRTLLTHTNITPFKSKTTRYYCAYCSTDGECFENPEKLRAHTKTIHSDERIRKVEIFMRPAWSNEILKVDVKDLKCTTCNISIPDWNNLFVHFAEAHDLEFNEAYTRIIPYCLEMDLKCILCLEDFQNFGHLDGHMNSHFCNYICYECGDTFLAASRLDKHLKVHKVGRYPCHLCKKMFTLDLYRSKHINLVHNQDSNIKCLYCPEKFVGTFQRHLHVSEFHPDKVRILTCEYCGKSFTWKPYFQVHKRRKHGLGEKKFECAECGKKFLMNYELRNHMTSHSVDKNYVCGLCSKAFKRLVYLKQHWKQHDQFADLI